MERLWRPEPGPQTSAYVSEADELFYGGAAGGGKSDLLLGLATTAHKKSLILRREAAQVGELTDRIKEICGNRGQWRGSGHGGTMYDLPGGRSVEMAGCKDEDDKQKYKGRPHDLKAFDELPDFTEAQYLFISGWARTSDPKQRCRIVGAGNPPSNAEGEWVIRRWAPWLEPGHKNPAIPGALRWYAMVDGQEQERENGEPFQFRRERIKPKSRTFIPARLSDNRFLMATGYEATIQSLPEPLRSQLLYGDFTVGRVDDAYQVIPTMWVKAAMDRWTADGKTAELSTVGVDPARGGADKTVIAKRYRTWFAPLDKYPGKATPDGPAVTGLILMALTERPEAIVNLDVIGIGSSVYDDCRAKHVKHVTPINFAEGTDKRDRSRTLEFRNMRAYAYWLLRDALDPDKGDGLALPPDKELLSDLTAARWKVSASGIVVEPKEDIIERLGRSPDCADAVVLAHLVEVKRKLQVW